MWGSTRPDIGADLASGEPRLRRTRWLTDGFAWLTATGVAMSVIATSGPAVLRFAAVGLIVTVLVGWALRTGADSWVMVAVEAAAVTVACFAAATPEPVTGLLFGVVTRRAVRGTLGPFLLRALPAVAAYVAAAVAVQLSRDLDPASLAPRLMPLLGLVIGTLALGDMLAAMREAQTARRATAMANEQLRERAEHDELTGVTSRGHFADLLQHSLYNNCPALLLVDLDDFKAVNDAHGHPTGDQVLIAVASRMAHTIGGAGVVGRLGGDEFAVLIPEHDEQKTIQTAERILTAVAGTEPVAGPSVRIRASIGIAVATSPRESADVLMRDADTALYAAKRAGGNRMQMFHQPLRDQLLARQQQEAELRQALAQEQFKLYYQPIVDLRTGAVRGAEALIRWQHPRRGLVAPGPVVELAEQTGLIIPLGAWVLAEACRQAVRWASQGFDIGMSVNISARQLHSPDFLDTLIRVLTETNIPPGRLTLELTESALAGESALEVLGTIQRLGVRVALDDFGTGYSSLSYLQRHRFDLIKIDRSFTAQLGHVPTAEGIVQAIVQLAAVLETPVVAEGVETATQAQYLASIGCALGQGYHFAKPTPPDDWRQPDRTKSGGTPVT